MSMAIKTEPQTESAPLANAFALPKSDVSDLLRSSASRDPLDYQALLDGCAGCVDGLLLMLDEFQSNAASRVEEIARHVETGDSEAVVEAAAMLKSIADVLSAEPLRALAATLEQFCSLMDRETQERIVERLRQETNRCLEHIPLLVASAHADTWAT